MWKVHGANVDSPSRFQMNRKQSDDDKLFYLEKELSKGGQVLSDSIGEKGRTSPLLEVLQCHNFAIRSPAVKFQLIDFLDAQLITYLLR